MYVGGGADNQGQEGETADLWPVATLTTGDNRKASDSLEIIPPATNNTNNIMWKISMYRVQAVYWIKAV